MLLQQTSLYRFIYLGLGVLGTISSSLNLFLLLKSPGFKDSLQNHVLLKFINIIIDSLARYVVEIAVDNSQLIRYTHFIIGIPNFSLSLNTPKFYQFWALAYS